MTQYLPWIYDILAIVLLLSYIHRASSRGLAATLFNMVSYLVSWAIAWPVSKLAAAKVFEAGLREGLIGKVEEKMAELPLDLSWAESAAQFVEGLPSYVSRLFSFGPYSLEQLGEALEDYSQHGAQSLVDEVLGPIVSGFLTLILFVIIFSLLLCVSKFLMRIFYHANDLPLVGPINSILGGVMGLLTGLLCLYVLIVLLQFVIMITGDSLDFLNTGLLGRTYTYRLFLRFDPIHFVELLS